LLSFLNQYPAVASTKQFDGHHNLSGATPFQHHEITVKSLKLGDRTIYEYCKNHATTREMEMVAEQEPCEPSQGKIGGRVQKKPTMWKNDATR